MSELKEYEANWLKNTKTVTRNASGQFASKVNQGTDDVGGIVGKILDTNKIIKNTLAKVNTAVVISKPFQATVSISNQLSIMYKDPELFKHNVSNQMLILVNKGLTKMVEKFPGFTDTLLNILFGWDAQKTRDKLADIYETVNPGLPNAIKPNPFKELGDDLMALAKGRDFQEVIKDLMRGFRLMSYEYNKTINDLNNLEGNALIRASGKALAAGIPIALFLGATLTPSISIGMLMGESLGKILIDTAVATTWSFIANKAMDKAKIENPFIRTTVDLITGCFAMSGMLDVRALYRMNFKYSAKKAKAIAAKMLEEEPHGITIPDNLDRIGFLTGGLGGDTKFQSILDFADKGGDAFRKTYWLPFEHFGTRKFRTSSDSFSSSVKKVSNVLEKIKEDNLVLDLLGLSDHVKNIDIKKIAVLTDISGLVTNTFAKGGNKDAIQLAAKVYHFLQTNKQDKEVLLFGYSAGGIINNEAREILKQMGVDVKKIKTINIGSPHFGITSRKGVTNVADTEDELNKIIPKLDKSFSGTPGNFKHGQYFNNDRSLAFMDWIIADKKQNLIPKVSKAIVNLEKEIDGLGKNNDIDHLLKNFARIKNIKTIYEAVIKETPEIYQSFLKLDVQERLEKEIGNSIFKEMQLIQSKFNLLATIAKDGKGVSTSSIVEIQALINKLDSIIGDQFLVNMEWVKSLSSDLDTVKQNLGAIIK